MHSCCVYYSKGSEFGNELAGEHQVLLGAGGTGDSNRGQKGRRGRKRMHGRKTQTRDTVRTGSQPSRREEAAGEPWRSQEGQDVGSRGKLGHILRKGQLGRENHAAGRCWMDKGWDRKKRRSTGSLTD